MCLTVDLCINISAYSEDHIVDSLPVFSLFFLEAISVWFEFSNNDEGKLRNGAKVVFFQKSLPGCQILVKRCLASLGF